MKNCQLCSERIQTSYGRHRNVANNVSSNEPNHRHDAFLCIFCLARLPWVENACHHCGYEGGDDNYNPSHEGAPPRHCSQCRWDDLARDQTLSIFRYRFPINTLIQEFKYQQQLPLLRTLASTMITRLTEQTHWCDNIQGIIPVPLHPRKLRSRGFNQCFWLAKRICKTLGLPLMADLCVRSIHTAPQSLQSAQNRKVNLDNAFELRNTSKQALSKPLDHVVIFDDVLTTGATVEAIAKLLKQAGTKKVSVWTLASAYG